MEKELYTKIILGDFNVENKKYIIMGTGNIADIYYDKICKDGLEDNILCFLEDKLILDWYKGKKVVRYKDLEQEIIKDENIKFITATISNIPLFNKRLQEIGISQEKIINPTKYFSCNCFVEDELDINRIIVYPPINNQDVLKKIIEDFSFWGCMEKGKEIIFLSEVDKEVNVCRDGYIRNINDAKFFDDDLYWVWNAENVNDIFLRDKKRVFCADSTFLRNLDSRMYLILNNKIDERDYLNLSRKNYLSLAEKCKKYSHAVVCGMGPSLRKLESEYSDIRRDGCAVVCNSFYSVDTSIIPDVYALVDTIWLSKEYNEQLFEVVQYCVKNKVYLFVNRKWISIIINRYPDISNYIIGVERQEQMCFPTLYKLDSPLLDNVVPGMAIPIASGLKNLVYIIGCDGHDKKGGWKHANGQYIDDSDFTNHAIGTAKKRIEYGNHVDKVYEKIFMYGEGQGKRYISLSLGTFEQLNKRYICI